ncbi:MAG TPA: urease accessory UreF family protein, partial [Burkholderiaceae bacterium]|nr:urease accessory UreF family protein [Burkholderiaceae bacterium]
YPVAVATAAAGHGIALRTSLEAFSLALVQTLVSATIRLSALGHSDGQRAIAALLPETRKLAREAQHATLDDLGGAAFRSDIAAMRHETQYTRLFRS